MAPDDVDTDIDYKNEEHSYEYSPNSESGIRVSGQYAQLQQKTFHDNRSYRNSKVFRPYLLLPNYGSVCAGSRKEAVTEEQPENQTKNKKSVATRYIVTDDILRAMFAYSKTIERIMYIETFRNPQNKPSPFDRAPGAAVINLSTYIYRYIYINYFYYLVGDA